MMFTSRKPVTSREIQKNKPAMENIYSASYDVKKRKWSEGKRLSDSVNEQGRNNSAIALSNDGQTLLLYRDDETGNGDIYQSVLKGSEWTRAEKLLPPVNSAGHESSASLSPDGNTLYFVSNRKGGIGKRGIWYCKKNENNEWAEAINMGLPSIQKKMKKVFLSILMAKHFISAQRVAQEQVGTTFFILPLKRSLVSSSKL
jgi:hypothetical protein